MRRGDGLRRVRRMCFALMMVAVMVLGAGCGGLGLPEPGGEVPGQSADDSSICSAYSDVLLENEEKIKNYYWQEDSSGDIIDEFAFDENGNAYRTGEITNKCIAFVDINNDGLDEMLFMSAEDGTYANLHIYRYDADTDEAVEIDYDYQSVSARDWQLYLCDAAVAGGSQYIVFTGTEPGTLYMAHIIRDETTCSDMTEYTCTPDGQMIMNWTVRNYYSYYDKSDLYYFNGDEVSAEEGSGYFVQARKNYGNLIMYSGYNDMLSVFKYVKSDSPAAMCFDDAMDWLNERID